MTINEHKNRIKLLDDSTIPIAVEYSKGDVGKVVHYYNPKTKINVMKDANGNKVYGKILNDGRQVWVEVMNGKIRNVGENIKPLDLARKHDIKK